MPSSSEAQHRLMEASAHGEGWAQKKVAAAVAKEYVAADKEKSLQYYHSHGRLNGN